jgi:hypothetical protein
VIYEKDIMSKIKETIELIQSAKRDLIIEKNQAAALIALGLATDILANIKEDTAKVWISRNKGLIGLVEIYTEEPELDGTNYYGPKKRSKGRRSGDYCPELFEEIFGLTLPKGACKQYELTLKEIK